MKSVQLEFRAFLTAASHEGELKDFRCGLFAPWNIILDVYCIGSWVGSGTGLDIVRTETHFLLAGIEPRLPSLTYSFHIQDQ
jgi:hypothetical protein